MARPRELLSSKCHLHLASVKTILFTCRTWQPGKPLPLSVPESPEREPTLCEPSVAEILQTLQASIDGQFTKVNSTLGDISERLQALESQQKGIEEEIEMRCTIPSPQPSSSDSGGPRKRRTPVSLQV